MSNITGTHDVVIYNGKNSPFHNQRLSVISFKTPSDKKDDPDYKRPEARCVSIPKLEISVTPQVLKDALQDAVEDLQDACIRKIVVDALAEGKNVITIMDAQINFESLAEFAKLEAANGKLNKDIIALWFDEDVGDQLTLALAAAMKLPEIPSTEEEKKLATAVTNYRNLFQSMAAPKAGLSPKIALQMQKALGVAVNREHRVFKALDAKIKNNLEQKDPELIGL